MVKIPEDFLIVVVASDQLVADKTKAYLNLQSGITHSLILPLDELKDDADNKIGLIIYIESSSEPEKFGKLSDFLPDFEKWKRKITKIPALKIGKSGESNKIRIRNIPDKKEIKELVDFVRGQLSKLFKISSESL